MKKVIKICEQITNAKIKESQMILNSNKENEKLRKVLNFVYNPFVTSGISDKKFYKKVVGVPTKEFKNFIEVLEYLKENNTGSDEVICNLQNYVKNSPEYAKDFIHDVVTKQLRLGIATTTINKAFKETFIPTFDVQLAENYYSLQEEIRANKEPFTLTLKLDGHRCLIIKNGDDVKLFARSGQLIEGCEEIEKVIRSSKYKRFVLDGELLAKVENSTISSKDRFRQTLKEVHKKGTKNNLEFFAFDFLTYKEFINKQSTRNYRTRRGILFKICSDLVRYNKNCPIIFLQDMYKGNDYDVIEQYLAKVKKKNLEGVMLNIDKDVYQFKRTKSLLKVKVMEDVCLRIIDLKEGKGKLKGTLGTIVCDYKGYNLGVGSGLTDEDRNEIWNNKKQYINKLAKIQYFEETQNDKGELSLRFPVYLGIESDRELGDFE